MNVNILRQIDKYLIWFLILLSFGIKYLFIGYKNRITKNPKRILIIRMWALGSSLLTFPMIKQLEEYFWPWVEYNLLASTRNIGVFKNQGYFKKRYNLFSIKDLLKLLLSFKRYDIVIDTEDYFMISAFISMRLWKINVWYKNIKVRWLAYNSWIMYNDKQHATLTFIDLAKKVWVQWEVPENLERLKYTENDKTKVDEFLKWIEYTQLICMHTWWAETAKERAWPQDKRVELIQKVIDKNDRVKIILSWTKGESKYVQELISKVPQEYHQKVINICWMFNIFEFGYLLERCDLMVSNDTGPMHLSAAMWTKTIWLFGPEIPRKFGPYPLTKNIWLYKGRWESYIKVHLWKWEKDTEYSINKIEVDDVFNCIEL